MCGKEEAVLPMMDDVYTDPEAELTLISSDNVGFKVHQYYLQAHSTVFRGMIHDFANSLPDRKIQLVDSQIEHSSTVRMFLDVITGKSLKLVRDSLGSFRNCILLSKKYECEFALSCLSHHASSFVPQWISPHYVFIIAAELDNMDLAMRAIAKKGNWTWPLDRTIPDPPRWRQLQESEESSAGYLGLSRGAGVLEVASWPIWEIERVPLAYMVALMKVDRKHSLAGSDDNRETAVEYFGEVMKDKQDTSIKA
ncbi:uncharacterized protein IL334_002311 [Kwoniella shivajii]|uniref:BTB domain-containing protein n=1 Tax=Kwoniella shivajii TaxID=564305 RepID=A0ABZ1CV20_9TREE|nr:hypothetical protein IL334_002311 [Kwoniella shivajii]